MVSYIVSKHELWSTNGLKPNLSFYPPSVNSALHFISKLRWWRSANGTQPHFVKWWTLGRAKKVLQKSWGRPSGKKWSQNLLHLLGFSTTFRLNGEYLLNETWHPIRQRRWKVRRASYVVEIFHELWSTNGLKPDRSFYPSSLFRFVPVRRTPSMRH